MTLAGAQNVLRYLLTNTEVFFFLAAAILNSKLKSFSYKWTMFLEDEAIIKYVRQN